MGIFEILKTMDDNNKQKLDLSDQLIARFAEKYTTSWGEWPKQTDFTKEEIQGLVYILEENKIFAFKGGTEKKLLQHFSELSLRHFVISFQKHCPDDAGLDELISIHARLFDDPNIFFKEFYYFLKLKNLKGVFLLGESLFMSSFSARYDTARAKIKKQQLLAHAHGILDGSKSPTPRMTIEQIDAMSGIEFENFLSTHFAEHGYNVSMTKASGDQGADMIITKRDEKIVIQAKRYAGNVGNSAIQEVVASKAFYSATSAIVVTNSFFTNSAIELARSNNVILWDRDYLILQVIHVK